MAEKDKKTKEKVDKKTKSNPEISDKVKVELEPKIDNVLEQLHVEALSELDDVEDISNLVEQYLEEIDQLGEALSVTQRIKKRQVMRRYRARINISRKRMSRRRATSSRINRRARKSAVNTVKQRFASGRKLSSLSYAERGRVERMASKRKSLISRTARRMVRIKRQQERTRLSRR